MNDINVRLGLEFVPGQAAAQASAEAEKIRSIFRRMNASATQGGILNPQEAIRFGRELSAAVHQALNQNFRTPLPGAASSIQATKSELTRIARDPATAATDKALIAALQRELNTTLRREAVSREVIKAEAEYAKQVQRSAALTRERQAGKEPTSFGTLSPAAQSFIRAVDREPSTPGYAENLGVAKADFQRKLRDPQTSEADAKLYQELVKEVSSVIAVERANRALEAAEAKAQKAIDAQANAAQRAADSAQRTLGAQSNREIQFAERYAKDERAAIRENNARDKRIAQDEKAAQVKDGGVAAREIRFNEKFARDRDKAFAENQARDRAIQERIGQQNLAIASRSAKVDADRAAEARQARNRAEADAEFRRTDPFPNATTNPNKRLGSAQEAVNVATSKLATATELLAAEETNELRSRVSARAAQDRLTQSERALTSANERLRQETVRAGTTPKGFGSQFALGFKGASDRPFAEQIGQAAKFSLFYGVAYKALNALGLVFSQTLSEGIAFQNEVTELQLATGRTKEAAQRLAEEVGKDATQYGFAASQGAQIAAKAQGYYGTTDASQATQDAVAKISTTIVDQIAFASGKQPDDIQGNLAAITQAYGLGAESQAYIGDLDAYFSRKFGADPGSTIGAISQSGTVGRAAGFSPAEVGAIAADIMARTGASEAAAGGYLAQIFSRAGEGQLTKLATKYDIDPQANLASQFQALAKVYAAQPNERDNISAAFGRGKVQNAVIALLQDYPQVQKVAKDATTEAGGSLGKATALRLDNIGGQIQETIGALRQFATDLGQTGVLDTLGAAVVFMRELTEAGSTVLEAFNLLPHSIRDVLIGLAALAAASKFGATSSALSGIAGRSGAGLFRSAGGAYGAGNVIGAGRLAIATEAGVVAPLASRVGGRAALGAIGATLLDPALLAVGGLLAVAALKGTSSKLAEAQKSAATTLNATPVPVGSNPEDYLSRASALTTAAQDLKEASSGITARILGTDTQDETRSELVAEAKRLTALAGARSRYLDNATPAQSSLITGFDAESLSSSLQLMTSTGASAQEQMLALSAAITGGADAAKAAAAAFSPTNSGQDLAGGALSAFLKATPKGYGDGLDIGAGRQSVSDIQKIINRNISATDVASQLSSGFAGLGSLADIDPTKATEIAQAVTDQAFKGIEEEAAKNTDGQSNADSVKAGLEAQKDQYVTALRNYILDQASGAKDLIDAGAVLTSEGLTQAITSYKQLSQAAIANTAQSDYKGQIAQARLLVQKIQAAIAAAPGGASSQDLLDLAASQRGVGQAQYNRLDALQKVAEVGVTSDAELRRIAAPFTRRKIAVAVKHNDADLLAQIISESGEAAIGIARDAINAATRADKAADRVNRRTERLQRRAQAAIASFANSAADTLRNFLNPDGGFLGLLPNALDHIQDAVASVENAVPNLTPGRPDRQPSRDVLGTTPYDPTANGGSTETAGQIAAARAQALAIGKQGDIAAARADIFAASVALKEADKNTVAYYEALGQMFQARQALSDAIVAYRENVFLLAHDVTDPLDQARAAVQAAVQNLRNDKGAGKDVIAADKVALQQAQASAEATRFQQRLDAVTTADNLGRISHQKYLNYLDHEHDRLSAIKNRTYQQQQELDQIDGLMKSAADAMAGQWNFGDIKLPTPYEVARRVKETYGEATKGPSNSEWVAGVGSSTSNTTTVYIDGADIGAVKKVLKDVLGERALTATTSPRHR